MSKAFAFRLERLLEIRRGQEDQARRAHVAARRALLDQERLVQGLEGEEAASKSAVRALVQERPDVLQLRLQEAWQAGLARRLRQAREALEERSRAEAAARAALAEARKAVRVLELHREKQLKLWREGADLEERRFLDEVARTLTAPEPPLRKAE